MATVVPMTSSFAGKVLSRESGSGAALSKRREGSQREDFTVQIHRRRTGTPAGHAAHGASCRSRSWNRRGAGLPLAAPLRRRRRAVPVLLLCTAADESTRIQYLDVHAVALRAPSGVLSP